MQRKFLLNIFFVFLAFVAAIAIITGFLLLYQKTPSVSNLPVFTTTPTATITPAINLNERLKICESIPNGAAQEIPETTRLFINLPEDIYPFENRQFNFNGATAGDITTSEGPVEGGSLEEFAENKCSTHYYDFEGNGTVDLKVKSAVPELPDYAIYFIVKGEGK